MNNLDLSIWYPDGYNALSDDVVAAYQTRVEANPEGAEFLARELARGTNIKWLAARQMYYDRCMAEVTRLGYTVDAELELSHDPVALTSGVVGARRMS